MQIIIPTISIIRKLFSELGLNEIYTQSVLRHIEAFIIAMALNGFDGKMTDVAETGRCHRTTASHFLSKSLWDEKPLIDKIHNVTYSGV
jgi:hypothetical protein